MTAVLNTQMLIRDINLVQNACRNGRARFGRDQHKRARKEKEVGTAWVTHVKQAVQQT